MSLYEMPLVSIVIPVYNGANYLREAIDSALSQTYPNIEVIVVNDGSTDDGATQAIALSYHDQIRYFCKENGGVSSALNFGIKQMKGEYFAWLSHDDIHYPQKTEKQMQAILKHTGNKPTICVCNYVLVDEDGRELVRSPENLDIYFRRSPNCFFGGETTLMIDGDATLVSKQVFDACGLFDESLFASQETDMWYRALNTADFIFISDYLVGYRTHPQQVTNKRKKSVGIEAGAYRGNLIKQASLQEMQDYYCSKQDAFRMGTSTYSYMSLHFYEAAHQAVSKLRQLSQIDWKYTYNALSGMFEPLNIKEIQSIFQADIAQANHKKKILVYCTYWNVEGQFKRIAPLMSKLRSDFEFILVYDGEHSNTVPPNIPSICLGQSSRWNPGHHPARLALLAELFNVDILWLNAISFMPMAGAVDYLKGSAIRTVASFHFGEPTAYAFEEIAMDEADESPLADAAILTHEQNDLMFTHYVYPYDAIFLPTIQTDPTVVEKWKLLFRSLPIGDNKAEVRRHFTLIDGTHKALDTMEIIERIKPYLEKYENDVLDKQRMYYEDNFYWKVTKPLRVVSDLARKLVKHVHKSNA